jgi:hypothetical protein
MNPKALYAMVYKKLNTTDRELVGRIISGLAQAVTGKQVTQEDGGWFTVSRLSDDKLQLMALLIENYGHAFTKTVEIKNGQVIVLNKKND